MWRMAYLAAAAVICWGLAVPAGAQKEEQKAQPEAPESASETGGDSGKGIEVTLDPDLDREFVVIEIVVQIAVQVAEAEGETVDLVRLEKDLLEVAETDRQRAYVHMRIAELHYGRGDRQAAIGSLKTALPLADGDRSSESLYFDILRKLLTVYDETGQVKESIPYHQIYREIISAGANPWEELPDTEDVIHKPTGIRLPHMLGDFKRTELVIYDRTGRDAGGTYRIVEDRLPLMSVYLVAEFEQGAEDHFNTALGHILNRFKGAKVRSKGPFSAKTQKGTVEGFAAMVDVPPGEVGSLRLGSDLYVFVRDRKLIKFRVSFPARDRDEIKAAMRGIFKEFDWP
jgi:hypothetical protein